MNSLGNIDQKSDENNEIYNIGLQNPFMLVDTNNEPNHDNNIQEYNNIELLDNCHDNIRDAIKDYFHELEYGSQKVSYRAIAEKHGIDHKTLSRYIYL